MMLLIAAIVFLCIGGLVWLFWDSLSISLGLRTLKEFTREELSEYDGRRKKEVYLGCKGYVFDVGKSQSYRPGAPYSIFAGRDATIGLAKMSLDPVDLETRDTSRLTETEVNTLEQWFKQFKEHYKYPIVGTLVNSRKGV